jgi:DNA-binding CsgD family transcriptional regulator
MTELIETVPNVAIEDDCVTLINKQQEKLLYISLIMTAKKVEGYDVDPEDLLEVSPDIYFGFQPLLKGLPDDQNRFNGVMVFAVGHTLIRPLPAEKLALIFGLSEKESQTAALLAQGRTIKQIAEQQSVSVNTIKFHLKSIFTKTGCTTQLSLMNLINSIPFSN